MAEEEKTITCPVCKGHGRVLLSEWELFVKACTDLLSKLLHKRNCS